MNERTGWNEVAAARRWVMVMTLALVAAGCDGGGGGGGGGGGSGGSPDADATAPEGDAGSGGDAAPPSDAAAESDAAPPNDAGPLPDGALPDGAAPDLGVECSRQLDCGPERLCLEGRCTALPACETSEECPDGTWCACEDGVCGAGGLCRPMPVECPAEGEGVCGCDGVVYANACLAQRARTCVSADPAHCAAVACESDAGCPSGLFCDRGAACGGAGQCAVRPVGCDGEPSPVCGCDERTYDSACEAARAGVSVRQDGACPEPVPCADDGACDEGQFCGRGQGFCALPGTCANRPVECSDEPDAVCGCDGETYLNACLAARAGASVDYRGECRLPGCATNEECGGGFCRRPDGQCGAERGECEPRPDFCGGIFDPVCGCDGETYGNACSAAQAGASIDSRGECEGGR